MAGGEKGGLTMQVHTDCFAYNGEGHCKALRQMDCYQCPFYKTKKELEEQLQKLGRRMLYLLSLRFLGVLPGFSLNWELSFFRLPRGFTP